MPILILILALLLPRVSIFFLWLLTDWFTGVFQTMIWPILGFIFMPYTLLWYSVVANVFSGIWGPLALIGMLLAIILDLSSEGYSVWNRPHRHVYVVEEEH